MTLTKEEWQNALAKRHGEEIQRRFESATVAICGLGGLGSNIAVCLARVGIGRLILIDFDKVDISNLHRQQYNFSQVGKFKTEALGENLRQINPFIDLETHTIKITEDNAISLLNKAQIICEAFDNSQTKAMLTNLVLEKMPDKYYIGTSGMAGFGDTNDIKTRKITQHFYICGDFVSEVSEKNGLVSSRVMNCASHQAHKVLQILINEKEQFENE